MVSGMTVGVWLWLGVVTTVASARGDGSVLGAGEGGMKTRRAAQRNWQVVLQPEQPSQSMRCERDVELLTLKTELKQKATEARLKDTETTLEETKTTLEETKTTLEAVKTKQEETERKLEATRTALLVQSKRTGGSTFVRWGRTTCPRASQLVYSGVAGGGWFDHTGSAANQLCLTMTPQSDGTPLPGYYTYLYGAEYESIPGHNDQDVPCSVCLAAQSSTIMIPATRYCPLGWTTQYSGYLASGHHTHKAASEYVCLDKDPEQAPGGHSNKNGNLFYYTVTQCGSLPCPPYTHNKIVLCVVCSK
ncbi:uncharacterized protein LOC143296083 [Babylonia areolata]|uniref:uncharacterized protein LOC143296083 n=1 Tax=Babylonia areolata TaxID=304850 RepID=UPI003FD396A5